MVVGIAMASVIVVSVGISVSLYFRRDGVTDDEAKKPFYKYLLGALVAAMVPWLTRASSASEPNG